MPVLSTGTCVCVVPPKGEQDMKGYVRGLDYKYEHVKTNPLPKYNVTETAEYYKVYHHNTTYFESCTVDFFNKHFKIT